MADKNGKWLSTVRMRTVPVVYFHYNPCKRTPSNTVRLLVSYFYADDIMGVAYLKKTYARWRQISKRLKKDVK